MEKHYDKQFKLDAVQYYCDHKNLGLQDCTTNCRYYMTDDLIHTILDIVGIKTPEFDETRSVINEKFNAKRKKIYTGKDYDKYWKNRN